MILILDDSLTVRMDLQEAFQRAGFECVALTEGVLDLANNEMLQVDGVFVRR